MKTISLLENVKFRDQDPHAEVVHYDVQGRAIRFMLKAGQSIREHTAPSSPVFAVVLRGKGTFAGGDGVPQTVGPNTLLVFSAGENHTINAVEELVFVGFLHGIPEP